MNEQHWEMKYVVREHSEIGGDLLSLYLASLEASQKSYSPYSDFPVGAALLTEHGDLFSASNQENVAFPAGCCAERSLLHYYRANHPDTRILHFGIIAPRYTAEQPVTPCGICRQALAEAEKSQEHSIELHLFALDGPAYSFASIRDLLPFAFEDF